MIDFSLLSSISIIATLACGPFYAFATYYYAGVGWRRSLTIATGIALWGLMMILFVREWQFAFDNPYIVPVVMLACVIVPSVLVVWKRDYFVPDGIGVGWLIGVQAFRFLGGLYLLEFFRGFIGTEFAYFAGTGDVITAMIASILLGVYFCTKKVPIWTLYALTIFGFADFIVAYVIGILSLDTPLQIFATNTTHAAHLFPIGMIPFLLAPIAMAFHWIMFLTLHKRATSRDGELHV